MTITKEDFLAYEDVRKSGVTNMYDTRMVEDLSGLTMAKILLIMKNYTELKNKYLN